MSHSIHPQSISMAFRLRIKVELPGGHIRCVDMSIPAASCWAEVLDDILEAVEAPIISTPWHISTAIGVELDYATPLSHLPISQGSTIIIRPYKVEHMVNRRDAAEALVDIAHDHSIHGLSIALFFGGICAFIAMTWSYALFSTIFLAFLSCACAAFAHYKGIKNASLLGATASICLAISGILFLHHYEFPIHYALLGGMTLGIASCFIGLIRNPLILSALLSIFTAILLTALVAFLLISVGFKDSARIYPSILCCVGIAMYTYAPSICSRLAGLSIPHLPNHIDENHIPPSNSSSTEDAHKALSYVDGAHCAAAFAIIGGLFLSAVLPDSALFWPSYIAIAGLGFMHCLRTRSTLSSWTLWLIVISSLISWACITTREPHWSWIILGLFIILSLTAPLISTYIHKMAPTTIALLEKAESIAIALSLPLLAYSMGLFHFIRGLL